MKDMLGRTELMRDILLIRDSSKIDTSYTEQVLSRTLDINDTAYACGNQTALHMACYAPKSRSEIVAVIMQDKYKLQPDPAKLDIKGRPAAFYAAHVGDAKLVQQFLTNPKYAAEKSYLSMRDKDGRNILHAVCIPGAKKADNDHIKSTVITLADAFNPLLWERDIFGLTPMHYAIHYDMKFLFPIFEYYYVGASDLHVPRASPAYEVDYFGNNDLMRAVTNYDLAGIDCNLKYNNPSAVNHMAGNQNAMHLYMRSYYISMEFPPSLREYPAHVFKALDVAGNSILHIAAWKFEYGYEKLEELMFMLANKKIAKFLCNLKNIDGKTPLHIVAEGGHAIFDSGEWRPEGSLYLADLLLKYGGKDALFMRDKNNFLPAELADISGRHVIAQGLRQRMSQYSLFNTVRQMLPTFSYCCDKTSKVVDPMIDAAPEDAVQYKPLLKDC